MSINLVLQLKLTMFVNISTHPMHYSRPLARKINSKRENHSQHICKSSTGKKEKKKKPQLIFASKERVKVNQRRKFLLIFFSSQSNPSKKTALCHTLAPKCTHPFFHVNRKGSVKQGKLFLKC